MKLPSFSLLFLFSFLSLNGFSQETIYPNLEGDDLLDAVVEDFKPDASEVMSYGDARDILYRVIDRNSEQMVTCIYSEHQVHLPDGEDPTEYIFQNGSPNGINTEHTYPQSMGAEFGSPKSDMHHLFPARVAVNTARSSLPFDDIQDFETDVWYYKTSEQSNIPSIDRDFYSEGTNEEFEPREASKGNVARAMFYFYTMYKAQADAANSTFFNSQRNRLCQWHFADPADQSEINRTNLIAVYQGDKANPFVLDCTLAARTYCANVSGNCTTSTQELASIDLEVYPNPASEVLYFKTKENLEDYQFQLWSVQGGFLMQTDISSSKVELLPNSKGLYFYTISDKNQQVVKRGKIMLQ